MLVNRRQVLVSFGLTSCSEMAWPLNHLLRPFIPEQTSSQTQGVERPTGDEVGDRLQQDLKRLAPRAYSEEGIPVFLATVNLVRVGTTQPSSDASPTALSATLASEFRRNADAFRRLRPKAQAKDIAPIIEVLPDRDFSTGGTTEAS